MKRLFALVLIALVLVGCGKQSAEVPETTLQQETQPDPGWYVPDSEIERTTNGAIRVYDLPANDVLWVRNLGNNLLLATASGFTVLSGENCVVSATVTPEFKITENPDGFQFTTQGLAYYLSKSNEAVYLDQQLEVISRIELPEKPDGAPIITPDGNEIFYCVGDEIRAYDTTRNITRPVKKQLVKEQNLVGVYFGGKVLVCNVVLDSGERGIIYLDSETGETLSTNEQVTIMDSNNKSYFAVYNDGMLRQEIFGVRTEAPSALDIPDGVDLIPAVALDGVVGVTLTNGRPVKLSMYDFKTGCITNEVKITGVDRILSSFANKGTKCLWMLVEEGGANKVYCWNPEKSKIESSTSYVVPVYTPENPDENGLDACNERVKKLNKTHGVEIRLWKDAMSETDDHVVVGEHQPYAIHAALDDLEKTLQVFPQKFLRKSATRPLRICLVRSIDDESQSVQFYKKTGSYILLSVESNIEREFIKALGYVVNSRVVSNSPVLDTWTKLNPKGFTYGTANEEYLVGENRAFADMDAMISVVEDRSRIFAHAMTEDNAKTFESVAMQKKLQLLCKGIREVWGWKKETATFPWEQYLHKSIAYVKK